MYCIREDYTARSEGDYDYEINITDNCQDVVYKRALEEVQRNDYKSILDIGCGRGYKLVKYFKDYTFLGLDLPPTVDWLRETYPMHNWEVIKDTPPQGYDLVICSDAIEHVQDPDKLVEFIKQAKPKKVVISTPDRILIEELFWKWYLEREPSWNSFNGPPFNKCHLREWTFDEFERYMFKNFRIEDHYHADRFAATQCVVARLQE